MAFEPQKKTFKLPVSKIEVTYRSEKVEDDIVGMKIATEGIEDKNDRTSLIFMLQKIKVILGVESFNGQKTSIKSWSDYHNLVTEIMQNPQDYRVLDMFYSKFNGDAAEAEAYVKNLLTVPVS